MNLATPAGPAAHDGDVRYREIDSPIGRLLLSGRDDVLYGLDMETHRGPDWRDTATPDDHAFPEVVAQLEAYFAGELTRFDVHYELVGTPFQETVWTALTQIPYGETISYGEQARRIGSPGASRAVGLANGRNPISIIVPCHRVIGANGRLTGYGGGLDRKRALLDLERRHRGEGLF